MEQQGVSQCIHKQVDMPNTHACHSVGCGVGGACEVCTVLDTYNGRVYNVGHVLFWMCTLDGR